MTRLMAALAAFVVAFACTPANAKHRHHYRTRIIEDGSYLPHPSGCPRIAFCACGAAVEIFGKPIRELWPARAWYKFPRSNPAAGTVAVRAHHVFVLREHIDGSTWLVADFNSGGHRSRLHQRSISGYAIVNPREGKYAANWHLNQETYRDYRRSYP